MGEKLLKVENLKKYFETKKGFLGRKTGLLKAVDNVSFSIDKGITFGLVGESGCGKSTTGRAVLNLIEPTGGRVEFDGKVIYDVENNIKIDNREMANIRRNMQIIFQDPYASLDPRMNVGDIVMEGMKKHKVAQGQEAMIKAKEILELCGLNGDYVKRYPHEFSGGQRQRIGIARALAVNPKFIVGDEPIAALDVSIQAQVLNLLEELKEKMGLTYLFISHDLGVVKHFCDYIGVMYLGILVETGSASEIYGNPFHPYTKALISAIPVSHPSLKKDRILLTGEIPNPINPPSGCRFRTRCNCAMDICSKETPVLKEIGNGHSVACHLL